MNGFALLIAGAISFVGTHFILSHPLRAPLVARLGDRGFQLAYILISFATFWLMVKGFQSVPPTQPFWPVGDGLWMVATAVMWIASVLFVGSVMGNPALPTPSARKDAVRNPGGVFRITRHPMMWGFALWGVVHILIAPRIEVILLCGSLILLALVGSRLQDGKKFIQMGNAWSQWQSQTSFVPFGRGIVFPGWLALIGGTVLWLVASWAHMPAAGIAAGLFRWL